MNAFSATLRREFAALWLTPLAWLLLVATALVQGWAFVAIVSTYQTAPDVTLDVGPLQAFYGQVIFIPMTLLVTCATLTMRSFAEESRTGTIENILSAPVPIASVVLGKFVAFVVSLVVLWLPTVVFPILLMGVIEVEWRVVAGSYLGILGIGAGFISVGMLCSTFARSQFAALAISSGALLLLWVAGTVQPATDQGPLAQVLDHISLQSQLREMSLGLISTNRLILNLSLVLVPLYACVKTVESRRWS